MFLTPLEIIYKVTRNDQFLKTALWFPMLFPLIQKINSSFEGEGPRSVTNTFVTRKLN